MVVVNNGISTVLDALGSQELLLPSGCKSGKNCGSEGLPTVRVGVVDDDPAQLDLISHCMRSIGFLCHCFSSGEDLIEYLRRERLDLLILDWQMPGMSGLEVVTWVRKNSLHWIPIVFATSRITDEDILKGFSSGADDYMTKPIRVLEMVARVRALLRRSVDLVNCDEVVVGPYTLNKASRSVFFEGQEILLKDREFAFALLIFSRLGCLLSREQLVESVWAGSLASTSRALDTLASTVRNKLRLRAESGFRLSAVYGVGYRLERISGYS